MEVPTYTSWSLHACLLIPQAILNIEMLLNLGGYGFRLTPQYVRPASGRIPVRLSVGPTGYGRNEHADGMK